MKPDTMIECNYDGQCVVVVVVVVAARKDMGTRADILALGHFEGERKRMVLSKVFCKKRKHILCTFYALTLKVLHSGLKGNFVAVK